MQDILNPKFLVPRKFIPLPRKLIPRRLRRFIGARDGNGKAQTLCRTGIVVACIDSRLNHKTRFALLNFFDMDAIFMIKIAGGGLSLTGGEKCHRRQTILQDLVFLYGRLGIPPIAVCSHLDCQFVQAKRPEGFVNQACEIEYHSDLLRTASDVARKAVSSDARINLGIIRVDCWRPKIISVN